jgi:hypothetical protein
VRWRWGSKADGGTSTRSPGTDIARQFRESGAKGLELVEIAEKSTFQSAVTGDLGSLITESWNQFVEWLKRLETLRDCLPKRQKYGLDT